MVASSDGDRVGFGGRRYRSRLLQTLAYDDTFDDYLRFLGPRLERSRELLAPHGTLYFHIDYREAHYCKLLLDEVFGREAFLNELIWSYDYGAKPRRRWPAKHDTILVYVRTPGGHWFDADAVEREPYMAPGLVSAEKAARGKRPTDVWFHTIVPTNGREKTGYPTQKPEGVLRRMVAASSRPGGWCLDPFAGSGTLGAVCRGLGRRFVLVDRNPVAIEIMRSRLGYPSVPRTSGTNCTASSRWRLKRPPRALGHHEMLLLAPDRRHHASAVGELILEGLRGLVGHRRGDVDRVERSLLGPPVPPVADPEADVVDPEAGEGRPGGLGQLGVALDRVHVLDQQGEQRRVVARTGADVQHAIGRSQPEHLEHPRHHQRLGDGLAAADRERHVGVRAVVLGLRDEPLSGDAGDRREHALVADGRA